MEEILSWSEFTQAFPRETGFDADKLSRDIVGAFIKVCYNNYDMNIQFSEGNNCSDLYWESPVSGTKFIAEIKDRYTYDSTSFNNHIVEDIKVKALNNKLKNGVASHAVLFSLYNDGVIKITRDIFNKGSFLGQQNSICPKTTTLGDNTPTKKILYRFKPDSQYYFRIHYYSDTDTWAPEFSTNPIFEKIGPEFIESIKLL